MWVISVLQSMHSGSFKARQSYLETEATSTCSSPLWSFLGKFVCAFSLWIPDCKGRDSFNVSLNVASFFISPLRPLWTVKLSEIIWTFVFF